MRRAPAFSQNRMMTRQKGLPHAGKALLLRAGKRFARRGRRRGRAQRRACAAAGNPSRKHGADAPPEPLPAPRREKIFYKFRRILPPIIVFVSIINSISK